MNSPRKVNKFSRSACSRAAVAAAAAASLVLAVGGCSSSSTEQAWFINPDANKETNLADGSYVITTVSFRGNTDNECMYGGTAQTLDGVDVDEVRIYGTGPKECPNYVDVRVYFNVVDGVQVIERITSESPLDS